MWVAAAPPFPRPSVMKKADLPVASIETRIDPD
jgi:hypothetical protein